MAGSTPGTLVLIDDMDEILTPFNSFGSTLAQANHTSLAFVRVNVV
jgi:hypothetical protein